MHKTNCMQSIKNNSTWEVFSSICPYSEILFGPFTIISIIIIINLFSSFCNSMQTVQFSLADLDKYAYQNIIFSYFSSKTYVVGNQKNRLNETVLLSTKNI